MKRFIMLMVFVVLLVGCVDEPTDYSNDSDSKLQEQTKQAMGEANRKIGMPAINNFQERKLAKLIFELRDKADLITYAYITAYTGQLVFIGKCIGFGLPYSVQYTNPVKVIEDPNARYEYQSSILLPQADPNGLYMPQGLSATWLMMINPTTGEAEPVYIEQEIMVSPFKLH